MLLALTACGGENSNDGGGDAAEYVYTAQSIPLPEDVTWVERFAVQNDRIYIYYTYYNEGLRDLASGTDETGAAAEADSGEAEAGDVPDYGMVSEYAVIRENRIASFLPDGSDLREFTYEGQSQNSYVQSMVVDQAGDIYLLENVGSYGTDASGEISYESYKEAYVLTKLDAAGNTVSTMELTEALAEYRNSDWFYIDRFLTGADGNIYLAFAQDNGSAVVALDPSGGKLVSLALENYIQNLVRSNDGRVLAMAYGDEGYELREIDPAAKGWGKTYSMGVNCDSAYSGNAYSVYYQDGSKLYGYDLESGESTELLTWLDAGVSSSYIEQLGALSEDRFVTRGYDNATGGTQLSLLTKQDASELANKTTLTLAAYYLDDQTRAAIVAFNNTNTEYRISATEYSNYATENDWQAGLTKLNTEIMTGNVPDILCLGALPTAQYAGQGILEDLYPYLDSDPELNRADFVESVLRALETDGKLYELGPSFYPMTIVGNADAVGAEPGWTFSDMLDLARSLPEDIALFGPYLTKDTFLNYAMYFNQGDYVNWAAGTCNFDSQEFIDLLEFCNMQAGDVSYDQDTYVDENTLILEGKQLLKVCGLWDASEIQLYEYLFNNNATYIGFPTSEGVGTGMSLDTAFGISATSRSKDAAWRFVRQFFSEDYQAAMLWGLPTSKAVLEKKLADAVQPEDSGTNSVSSMTSGGGFTYEYHKVTQEEADIFLTVIDTIGTVLRSDGSLNTIVMEEAAAYFAGTQTAERTAEIIQDRITTYINE